MICALCNKEFVKTNHNKTQKYCSPACSFQGRNTRRQLTCEQCHKSFIIAAADIRRGRGKFCSHQCAAASHVLKRVRANCLYCGKFFTHLKSRTNAKFCSNKCAKPGARMLYLSKPENRERARESIRYAGKQRWLDPKQRAAISQQFLKLWADPIYKAKTSRAIRSGLKRLWADPELYAKTSAAMSAGRKEIGSLISEQLRSRWADPTFKAQQGQTISVALKKFFKNPQRRK